MYGVIIAIYEREPYAHMITSKQLCADVAGSLPGFTSAGPSACIGAVGSDKTPLATHSDQIAQSALVKTDVHLEMGSDFQSTPKLQSESAKSQETNPAETETKDPSAAQTPGVSRDWTLENESERSGGDSSYSRRRKRPLDLLMTMKTKASWHLETMKARVVLVDPQVSLMKN